MANSAKEDLQDVQKYAKKVASAVESDKRLVEAQAQKISALKTAGLSGIVDDMISTAIYSLAGQCAPYVYEGIGYAKKLSAKSESAKKSRILQELSWTCGI